ncbi:MAG: hypothetical protein ABL959_17070 [Pyrinomonadaceae bacterium]
MRKFLVSFTAILAAFTVTVQAQDDSELRIKKALEGRHVLVKMDMPAVENGVEMLFDEAEVSFDQAGYNKLVKQYGVSLKKGHRARITDVRISNKGIEIDLDGGGSPGRDWVVGGLRLVEPAPVPKSDRELDLERQVMNESAATSFARTELDYERQQRNTLDERNRQAYERVSSFRTDQIEKNRKEWGSKIVIVVRSNKMGSVTLGHMARSLSKYCELLPREPVKK